MLFCKDTVKLTVVQLFFKQESMILVNSAISQIQANELFCRVQYYLAIAICVFLSLFSIDNSSTKNSTICGRTNITLWLYQFTIEESYAH